MNSERQLPNIQIGSNYNIQPSMMISSETTDNRQHHSGEELTLNHNEKTKLQQEIADLEKQAADIEDEMRIANRKKADYEEQMKEGEDLEEIIRKERLVIYNARKRKPKVLQELYLKKSQLRKLEEEIVKLSSELTKRLISITKELASNLQNYDQAFALYHQNYMKINSQVINSPIKQEDGQLDTILKDICSKKNQLLEQRRKINQIIKQKHLDIQITITDSKIEYSRQRFNSLIEFQEYLSMKHNHKYQDNNLGSDPDYPKEKDGFKGNVEGDKQQQCKQSKIQLEPVLEQSAQEDIQIEINQEKEEEKNQLQQKLKTEIEKLQRQKKEKQALLLQKQKYIKELKLQFQQEKSKYIETDLRLKRQKISQEMIAVKQKMILQLKQMHQQLAKQIQKSRDLLQMFEDMSQYRLNLADYSKLTIFLEQITEQLQSLRQYLQEEKQIEQFKRKKRSYYQQILEPLIECPKQNLLKYLPEKQFYLQKIQNLKAKISPQNYILLKMKQLSLKYQKPIIQIMKNRITFDNFDIGRYNTLLQKQISLISQMESFIQDANRFSKIKNQLSTINQQLATIYAEQQQKFAQCSFQNSDITLVKDTQKFFIQIKKQELAQVKQNNCNMKKSMQSLKLQKQKMSKDIIFFKKVCKQGQKGLLCQNGQKQANEIETKEDTSLLQAQTPVQINNLQQIKSILQQFKVGKSSLQNELQYLKERRIDLEQSFYIEQMKSISSRNSFQHQNKSLQQHDLIIRLTNEMIQLLNQCKQMSKNPRYTKNKSMRTSQVRSK